jgi:uncharacterized membrane protein (DUF485 family)
MQKWHPDKQKDEDNATSRFQEINEAYQGQSSSLTVLSSLFFLVYINVIKFYAFAHVHCCILRCTV